MYDSMKVLQVYKHAMKVLENVDDAKKSGEKVPDSLNERGTAINSERDREAEGTAEEGTGGDFEQATP